MPGPPGLRLNPVVRIVLCTVAGALVGGGIAVSVASRQPDGFGLILPLGVGGLLIGGMVGATVGAVTG